MIEMIEKIIGLLLNVFASKFIGGFNYTLDPDYSLINL